MLDVVVKVLEEGSCVLVVIEGYDEIGWLVVSFNWMLVGIVECENWISYLVFYDMLIGLFNCVFFC